jgi:hypothetical protein
MSKTRTVGNPAFDPKDPSEIVHLGFDFSALTSAPLSPAVTAAHHAGTADATPSAILSGSPTVSGTKIVQRVTGGVVGADYLLRCQVDTAAGERFVLAGVLPVRAA